MDIAEAAGALDFVRTFRKSHLTQFFHQGGHLASLPLFVQVDPDLPEPLHVQLYRALRQAIDEGRIAPHDFLPSTRDLAIDLRIGRNTVLRAVERLKAEGLVEGRIGAGVRVIGRPAKLPDVPQEDAEIGPKLVPAESKPFLPETPALDLFPADVWARVANRRWRSASRDLIESGDSFGYRPLREAVADYLRTARGIRCTSEQILIASGAKHAFEIVLRALAQPGDAVVLEDPCRPDIRRHVTALGMRPVPVPVDREGFSAALGHREGGGRIIALSPGCHVPTGVTLSLRRRKQIVQWAKRADAWIIEDDQFSVTRFVGRPLPTVHSLDESQRTILIGSFEQELFPGLRVGYAVLPNSVRDLVFAARTFADQHVPTSAQATLADFISEGHFARHLHRLKQAIAARYDAVSHALSTQCGALLDPWPANAGVHIVAWLPRDFQESAVVDAADQWGVAVRGLSEYSAVPTRPGIVLSFGGWTPEVLTDAARRLSAALAMVRSATITSKNGIDSFADAFRIRR